MRENEWEVIETKNTQERYEYLTKNRYSQLNIAIAKRTLRRCGENTKKRDKEVHRTTQYNK